MSRRRPSVLRHSLFALATLVLLAGVGLGAVDRWAPRQDLPWRPLRLDDPIGLATRFKVSRTDFTQCRAILADGGVQFDLSPPRTGPGACSQTEAGRLGRGVADLKPARPLMRCQEALRFAIWERQAVQPAARAELGSPVRQIEHLGTYACRVVRGDGPSTDLSQHAFANAIDVAGFTLADGREITVRRDFHRPDAAGRFLRRVRDQACQVFGHTLSPDYNAAHHDHLHLDGGRWPICR